MAVVKVTMNFEPNKVNIQKKNCRMEGKETVCINATVCFHVKLKSKEDAVYEAGEPTHTAGAGGQGAGGGSAGSGIKASARRGVPLGRDLHSPVALGTCGP